MRAGIFSEEWRKSIHVLMGGFALLLRYLPWWAAVLLAVAAVVSNATWIPRLGGGALMRESEKESLLRSGVWLYSFSILMLLLIFPHRLEVVAGAWGILALGDGFATLAGKGIGGPHLPWNSRKTWVGSAVFFAAGALGGAAFWWWVAASTQIPTPSFRQMLVISSCTALACAIVESLSLKLNDNLSVPFLAAGLLYSLQRIDPAVWRESAGALRHNFLIGVAVNLAFALTARALGAVSWSGVAGGLLVGVTITTFGGLSGFGVLAFFFLLGSAATRLGYAGKARRGIAQERGGARGAVHAMANCSVAAYLAFLAGSSPSDARAALWLAFVASLATATCDTLGSEIGPLGSGQPFLVTRLRRVPAGTPGAVSLLGTAAGVMGAILVGLVAALLHVIPPRFIALIPAAAIFGTFLESFLGATLEPLDLVESETINFINTLAGALAAMGLLRLLGDLP
ncbi:MAG: DUF92 domain-containing protein [Acidobacteria bacterium]|nr:DUF92 domain-containing protein [Acidobacteriota bacterium]